MPYIENDGVKVYYQVEGPEGAPAVFMHHGFLADGNAWRNDGWVEPLRDDYRLIFLDSRGHGLSDNPTRVEDFDFRTRVMDVVAILDAEGVAQAHYAGYSMGAMVGYETLIYAPQRFLSHTLGGSSPIREPGRRQRLMGRPFSENYQAALARGGAVKAALEAGHHDPASLEACRENMADWAGAEQAVRLSDRPLLLFIGTKDPSIEIAREATALNPGLQVLELPDDTHWSAPRRAAAVIPEMRRMLEATPALAAK